jgi:hypothetical protein
MEGEWNLDESATAQHSLSKDQSLLDTTVYGSGADDAISDTTKNAALRTIISR